MAFKTLGGMPLQVRSGAVMRGAGVALACLASTRSTRSGILFTAYTGAWFLGRPGLQIFMVIPNTDEPWKRATVPFATSLAAWTTVMLAASTALRQTRVPAPITAVVLGGSVALIDSLLANLGETRGAATDAGNSDSEPRPPHEQPRHP